MNSRGRPLQLSWKEAAYTIVVGCMAIGAYALCMKVLVLAGMTTKGTRMGIVLMAGQRAKVHPEDTWAELVSTYFLLWPDWFEIGVGAVISAVIAGAVVALGRLRLWVRGAVLGTILLGIAARVFTTTAHDGPILVAIRCGMVVIGYSSVAWLGQVRGEQGP